MSPESYVIDVMEQRGGAEADLQLIERAYREILVPAFTQDELPPWEEFAELNASEPGHLLLIALHGPEPVAMAVGEYGTPKGIILLSYLATRSSLRGSGLGSRLLQELRSRWSASGANLCIGEIHDPRAFPATETERPLDRVRFYERNGARLLNVPWIQPSLGPGRHRVRGMLLIVLHPTDAATVNVSAQQLSEWAELYFSAVEGHLPEDPEFQRLQARLQASSSTRVLRLDQLDTVDQLDD